MEPKKYTYYRISTIVQITFGASLALLLVFKIPVSIVPKIIFLIITVISNLILMLIFYKSVISVDHDKILFSYGIGIIKVPIEIKEIKACVPIDIPGVRFKGFLKRLAEWFNKVKGVKAVELWFYGKDTVLQLETKFPKEICDVVTQIIENNNYEGTGSPENLNRPKERAGSDLQCSGQ